MSHKEPRTPPPPPFPSAIGPQEHPLGAITGQHRDTATSLPLPECPLHGAASSGAPKGQGPLGTAAFPKVGGIGPSLLQPCRCSSGRRCRDCNLVVHLLRAFVVFATFEFSLKFRALGRGQRPKNEGIPADARIKRHRPREKTGGRDGAGAPAGPSLTRPSLAVGSESVGSAMIRAAPMGRVLNWWRFATWVAYDLLVVHDGVGL